MHQEQIHKIRIRLDIEYDGTDFHGWQIQPSLRTVQGELKQAVHRLLKTELSPMASGRTDTGVHASNQVVHCDIPHVPNLRILCRSLNAILPADISIKKIYPVSRRWDARRSAIARIYRYRIRRHPTALHRFNTWVYGTAPPMKDLIQCASLLQGKKNVQRFCRHDPKYNTFETYFYGARWCAVGPELHFIVCASHFYHRLVRRLVGAQILTPAGTNTFTQFHAALAGSEYSSPSAPPHGLCFVGPLYEADTTRQELEESWMTVMIRRYPAASYDPVQETYPEP